MIKASLPKGTRDFGPDQLAKRRFVVDMIREIFERYGFQPIETPAFEKLETLTGKYGDEGDRLIFKILNSGDFLQKVPDEILQSKNSKKITPYITEKALRYDLTVPLARYTVMHRNEIVFPFKRYQIQPVWRADRPQKGRFREFYQCDADVLGSKSLWQETEFIHLYNDVFKKLRIPVTIRINHRQILNDILAHFGLSDIKTAVLTALDKLDKAGWEKVTAEWQKAGVPDTIIPSLKSVFSLKGGNDEKMKHLREMLGNTTALDEMETILNRAGKLDHARLLFDLSLARGLDYYTGTVFEVSAEGAATGSIGGGGRYDDLTGIFGMNDVSGIGISFGLDRIMLVMDELGLFRDVTPYRPEIMFVNFGDKESAYAWKAVKKLREAGISAELYPDAVKLKKQMQYAHKRQIPYVALAGDREMEENTFTVKNMTDGSQTSMTLPEITRKLKE